MRFSLLLCWLLVVPVLAQQTQSTSTPAPQDPQAVSVLNQVLAAAGGSSAIKAISDYTATGNITYHWDKDTQGSVTVQVLGLGEVRIDASLPNGVYSRSIQYGKMSTKSLDGSVQQYPHPAPVPISDTFPFQAPLFPGGLALPYAPILAVLNNRHIAIYYKGLIDVGGKSVHDVQVREVLQGRTQPDSMAAYHTIDFFIDPNSFQIVLTQDMVPKNNIRQMRYSNYRLSGGVVVPFFIGETVGGQNTWEIELNGATFNKGLQDTDFVLQ
jgi:hypothetical protein